MKKIITALFTCCAIAGWGQTFKPVVEDSIDFVIEGTVGNGVNKVILKALSERVVDTPGQAFPVNDGHFRIVTRQPLHKFLIVFGGGRLEFIVDNQPAHIVMDLEKSKLIDGSPLNIRFQKYWSELDKLEDEMFELEDGDDLTGYRKAKKRLSEAAWKCIIENTDNVIPVYPLAYGGNLYANMLSPEQLMECMREEYPFTHHPDMNVENPGMLNVWEYFQNTRKRLVDLKYKDLELPDTAGVTHRLSEWCGKGRYVLIDFWASWCSPCRAEMWNVIACYEKFHSKGLDIIGISFDKNKGPWLRAIKAMKLPWINLVDSAGAGGDVASAAYNVNAIPYNVLLNGEGNIIAMKLRGDDLDEKLSEIFGE